MKGFRISCDAGQAGVFRAETDSVSIKIGQRIRHLDAQGMWDSVLVEAPAFRARRSARTSSSLMHSSAVFIVSAKREVSRRTIGTALPAWPVQLATVR